MKVSFKICNFLAIALLFCVYACGKVGGNGETAQEGSTLSQESNTTIYLNQEELPPVNDLARFLAGKPVDKFADIQSSEYYKDFAKKASHRQ